MAILDAQKEKVVNKVFRELSHFSDDERKIALAQIRERLEDLRARQVWEHAQKHPEELVNASVNRAYLKRKYGV